jgi:WD40 repeat protein
VAARALKGHTNIVTDVCFKPEQDNMVVSTADDHVIRTWDVRQERSTNIVRCASLVPPSLPVPAYACASADVAVLNLTKLQLACELQRVLGQ